MERSKVYEAIDSERDYQDARWDSKTITSDRIHSFEEWYTYIEDYIKEAKHILSRNPRQEANKIASDIMRKIGAMSVCAMEQHGVEKRWYQPEWEWEEKVMGDGPKNDE